MFKRKSIVLSDINGKSNQKAVLSLEEDNFGISGKLRLYNFSYELPGISSLGFYVDQKVYKAGLTYKSPMLYEFFLSLKQIPNKFSCAVVNFKNAVATPILYGSSEGNDENIYGNIIAEISKDGSVANAEKVLDAYGVDFEEQDKKQIEKDIDKAFCENTNCADCIYKKYFFENNLTEKQQVVSQEQDDLPKMEENSNDSENDNDSLMFIDKLKPQIDKLFENNPVESNLQDMIPDSKWVKVEYEDDGDFYVFGLLYDGEKNVKYVCYGVPAVFEEQPPKELAGYPIWLPLDKTNGKGFGYWLTYQDATTGEPVKAILD